ncbi:MAG: phytanoyl-CoA dioxygenase family protein [Lentisphaeria bacterium]|nr:phytanoyl-CoA dioxygenase family protein [Lentisphaeria bacterium]
MKFTPEMKKHWDENGCIHIPGVITPELAARLEKICDGIIERFKTLNPETGEPGKEAANQVRKIEHPDYHENVDDRLLIMETLAAPGILEFVEGIIGKETRFLTSTLFHDIDIGHSDGGWHRDTQFIYPDIDEQKKMITAPNDLADAQVMIALVPSEDSEYVPGSHKRWDTPEEIEIRLGEYGKNSESNEMPGAKRMKLEIGDLFAFNPNGLHRGRYHTDKPRRTIMGSFGDIAQTPKFFFSYQPWYLNEGFLDGLSDEARAFYQLYINKYQDFWHNGPVPDYV